MGRPKERIFTLLLLVAGLAVGGLITEIGLRVYAWQGDGVLATTLEGLSPARILVEPHGVWGYRQRPNSTYRYHNGTAATSNSSGFRGPDVLIPKPNGTFRIILLGGSATHGFGVNDGETIDAFMRELLRERYPDREFDVVNLAFDGYDSYQLLERLRSDGLSLEPDLVILNTGINDVGNARFANLQDVDQRTIIWRHVISRLREEQERGGPTLWTRIKYYSYTARLPGVIRHLGVRGSRDAAEDSIDIYLDAVDYFERNLRAIVEDAARVDAAVVLSVAPSSLRINYLPEGVITRRSYWLTDAKQTQKYRDRLARRLQEVADDLAKEGGSVTFLEHVHTPNMFLDDAHLTAKGNRILAADFVEAAAPHIEMLDR